MCVKNLFKGNNDIFSINVNYKLLPSTPELNMGRREAQCLTYTFIGKMF